jgi:hypothetical protein
MADNKSITGRVGEWLFLIVIIACVLLIAVEVGTNVLDELESRGDSSAATGDTVGLTLLASLGQTGGMEVSNSVEMGGGTS